MGRGEGGRRVPVAESKRIASIKNESERLIARVNQLERKLKQVDIRHAQNRKKNNAEGNWRAGGFRTAKASPNGVEEVQIMRGKKGDESYEMKWIPETQLSDYIDNRKNVRDGFNDPNMRKTGREKLSNAEIAEAFKDVKDILNGTHDDYKNNYKKYVNGVLKLAQVVNRYKGENYINTTDIRAGSSFSVSNDAKREIKKIEDVLGVKIL